jgi:mRNA interferase MazF
MDLNAGPRRGELVTIAISGDYGKPRPALVIQSDAFVELPSVTVLRLTSELHEWPLLRITVAPNAANGLRKPSQIMIDKATTVPRAKLGACIGRIEADTLRAVEQALQAFLGFEGAAAGGRAREPEPRAASL